MPRDPEVNVKVKADARELRKLREEGKSAFDKKTIVEYGRAADTLEKSLDKVVKRQVKLVEELGKVDKGTKAYKELSGQLKEVDRQASSTERSLNRIRRILSQQYRDQERAQAKQNQAAQQAQQAEQQARQARRRGFVGGFAQGVGVSEYIPSEPGQGARIGGAMLGRGMRRAAGGIAAPFQTPGVAGMAQGFGAIPLVGGFIGGAISTAAGMYQQAVGFQTAARGALFAQGAGFTPEQMKARKARAEIDVAREKEFGAFMVQTAEAVRSQRMSESEAKEKIAGKARKVTAAAGGTAGGALSLATALRAERARMEAASAKELEAEGGISVPEPPGGRRRPKEIYTNPKLIRQRTKERVAAIRARAAAQPTGLPGAGAGVQFGLGPQEMMQLFTQMMQARGGTFDDVRRSEFVEAMGAQTRFGVSAQQAGAFGRMGIRGGGGTGMGQGLAGVLQAAVASGLRGSQVTEYLQSLVQLGQQAERSGVKINVTEFTRGAATLTAAGLQGVQAQRVATGMQQAAMGVSKRGVQSPIDVLLARAAGFDPSQGPEGYARVMNKMAGGMTSDMMNKLLAQLTQGAGAGGFGPQMQSLMLRRAMGKMGVEVGPGQATQLLASYRKGTLDEYIREEETRRMLEEGERPGAKTWLRGEARAGVRRGAGLTVGAAGLQAFQVGVGARAAKWVVPLERASANAASAISRLSVLKDFAHVVERATKSLDRIMSQSGGVDLMDALKELIAAIRGQSAKPAGT